MTEFWLVISSACFNALLTSYQYYWIDSYAAEKACFDKILISDVEPNYSVKNSTVYAVVPLEKWRRMLQYRGDDPISKRKYNKEKLVSVSNNYALGTYQKYFGQLPTSTQIKILEKIGWDSENSEKIRAEATKLLWRLRIKIEEDLINTE